MKNWLKEHPCLSLRCLEKKADIPEGTLKHYMAGRRELNEKHKEKLLPVLQSYGFEKANAGGA